MADDDTSGSEASDIDPDLALVLKKKTLSSSNVFQQLNFDVNGKPIWKSRAAEADTGPFYSVHMQQQKAAKPAPAAATTALCTVHQKPRGMPWLTIHNGKLQCIASSPCRADPPRSAAPGGRGGSRYYNPIRCSNCGAQGHGFRECSEKDRTAQPLEVCYICGLPSHGEDLGVCPNAITPSPPLPLVSGLLRGPEAPDCDSSSLRCFLCGSVGHTDCSDPPQRMVNRWRGCPHCGSYHVLSQCPTLGVYQRKERSMGLGAGNIAPLPLTDIDIRIAGARGRGGGRADAGRGGRGRRGAGPRGIQPQMFVPAVPKPPTVAVSVPKPPAASYPRSPPQPIPRISVRGRGVRSPAGVALPGSPASLRLPPPAAAPVSQYATRQARGGSHTPRAARQQQPPPLPPAMSRAARRQRSPSLDFDEEAPRVKRKCWRDMVDTVE